MKNLLIETTEELARNGKTPYDVRWVGTRDGKHTLTWDTFTVMAHKEYDESFGWHEVILDLVVVGEDWWMERHEYDGSEWWSYKTIPQQRPTPEPLTTIWEHV
jgi:hypothetical protein